MREALRLAAQAWGDTYPNPMVGAVLVCDGQNIGSGYHRRAGEAHAEVEALKSHPDKVPPESTLYITLEPCSSHGRTPPCTDRILASGVKRVVVGYEDPDERHRGQGFEILRQQGIEVVSGILSDECEDLNFPFNFKAKHGSPMVVAKMATTIDGKVALSNGASRWITGAESRNDVHRWRRYFQTVCVGAGTILDDDPSLTARDRLPEFCPLRVLFDRSGFLLKHPRKRVFTDTYRSRTVIFTKSENIPAFHKQFSNDLEVVPLPKNKQELVDWVAEQKCFGLYLEGGPQLFSDFISKGWIDYLFAYRAPKLFLDSEAKSCGSGIQLDSIQNAITLRDVRHQTFGDDQLIRGYVTTCT